MTVPRSYRCKIRASAWGTATPWHARLDAVGCCSQDNRRTERLQCELFFGPADHGLGRGYLDLGGCGRWLEVDDDAMFEVDQIVIGICEEGLPAMAAGPARRPVGEMNFGVTSVAAPTAAWSCTARYSSIAGSQLGRQGLQSLERSTIPAAFRSVAIDGFTSLAQ